MTHYRLQCVPPHPHIKFPQSPKLSDNQAQNHSNQAQTWVSLCGPRNPPVPPNLTLFHEHPSSPTESLYSKINRGTLLTNCFRNLLVQISNIWPNTPAHCVRILPNKFLKLGTSQGEIWNHSDYNPPFPFFVLHFRTKKKLPFRFITNGNNPSFFWEMYLFQKPFRTSIGPPKMFYTWPGVPLQYL